ncbi:uncharacterized protein GLRG_01072 [Colletotrichum graminicola M1.001]|uniref:PQ loop repeat protein n=1 Tax=Colletotrichum graminicola (strain M1.001 / M2 / FGSC 10212) TaxID=645133 RepID=E3Q5G1_COLGM|nr:uncharacterized protein GLRG_01072 [Colletotrichum graminicola M1.001]EFQ25928.1 hypothetical protein GLRG_01072 [Colletotrichum graminicola M1.001]
MAMATFGRLVLPTQTLISRDDASEILGSISMAAFLCLLLPQLAANYRLKSADSLSMAFLFIWLLGDVTNLLGGLANHIAPASIAVTGYLCFSDTTLICQCLYYNSKQRTRDPPNSTALPAHDRQPLLGPSLSARDPRTSGEPQDIDSESAITLQEDKKILVQAVRTFHGWRFNLACILAVQLLGVTGWFVLRTVGLLGGDKPPGSVSITDSHLQGISESVGSALGVVGAVCYLCARIPQIIKNYRGKSCEALSRTGKTEIIFSQAYHG